MKSIISRYGELKEDPKKLVDSEGEELSLNKVDKALQSVGITLQDVNGQFRDFDEVIFELAGKWNTIDKNTQRYIATVMAGNRQQSRFLALLSSYDRLIELSDIAANSEDTATLQMLKTMDSIEFKAQQLQTSLQSLYTAGGLEEWYKGLLDIGNAIIKQWSSLGQIIGLPVGAIINLGAQFWNLAHIVTSVFKFIKNNMVSQTQVTNVLMQAQEYARVNQIELTETELTKFLQEQYNQRKISFNNAQQAQLRAVRDRIATENQLENGATLQRRGLWGKISQKFPKLTTPIDSTKATGISTGLSLGSLALNGLGIAASNAGNKGLGAGLNIASTGLSFASMGLMSGNPLVAIAMGAIGGIIGLLSNLSNIFSSAEQKLKELQEKAQEDTNESLQRKNETKTLQQQIDKIKELEKARYDSTEAEEKYYEATSQLAEKYPGMIDTIDNLGNVTIDLDAAERQLTESREESVEAARKAAVSNYNAAKQEVTNAEKNEKQKKEQNVADFQRPANFFNSLTFTKSKDDNTRFLKYFALSLGITDIDGKNDDELEEIINNYDDEDYSQFLKDRTFGITQERLAKLGMEKNPLMIEVGKQQAWLEENGFGDYDYQKRKEFISSQEFQNHIQDTELTFIERDYLNYISSLYGELNEEATTKKAQSKLTSTEKSQITNIVATNIGAFEEDYISNLTDSTNLVSKMLYQEWKNSGLEFSTYFKEDGQWEQDISQINNILSQMYDGILSPFKKDQLDQLLQNTPYLSESDFRERLTAILGEGNENIESIVSAYYDDNLIYTFDKFNKAFSEQRAKTSLYNTISTLIKDKRETLFELLGPLERQNIISFYDQVQDLVTNGILTQSQGENYLSQVIKLWEEIESNQDISDEEKDAAEERLRIWDGSIQELWELDEYLQSIGIESEFIPSIIKLIPTNLNTTIESYIQSWNEVFEEFSSMLEQAQKGMKPDKALEFVHKLGINLSDLDYDIVSNKYTYSNINQIYDYYNKELEQEKDNLDALQAEASEIAGYGLISDSVMWRKNNHDKDINELLDQKDIQDKVTKIANELDISANEIRKLIIEYIEHYEKEKITWQQFLEEYYTDRYAGLENQLQQLTASEFYSQKDFTNMFKILLPNEKDDIIAKYAKQFLSGTLNITTLPKEIQEAIGSLYSDWLVNGINSSFESFASTFANALKNGNQSEIAFNLDAEQRLLELGIKYKKSTDKLLVDTTQLSITQYMSILQQAVQEGISDESLKKGYDDLYKILTQNNLAQALLDAAGSTEALSEDQANALASAIFGETTHALQSGFFEPLADGTFRFVGDLQTALTTALNSGRMSLKNYNEAIGKIRETDFDLSAESIISDIISNRDKISSDNIESLANLLKVQYETIEEFFKDNGDGTFSADISQIENLVLSFGLQTNEAIQSALTDIFDSILSNLTGLVGNQTQGFTGIADMQKYIKQVNDQLGTNFVMQDMFQWSDSLHAFIFTTEGLQNQVRSMAQQLAYMSEEERWAAQKLIQDTGRQFAESIDIFSYINAESSGEQDKAEAALRQAVKDYDYYLYSIGNHSYVWISSLMSALEEGGQVAVAAGEQIAALQGKTLTADEVTSLYYASSQGFADAFEALGSYAAGSMMTLSNAVIKALEGTADIDSALVRIGNTNQFVVKDTKKLVDVYTQLYEKLKTNTNATLAEVNEAYTQLAMLNSDNDLIEALNNGAAMSIDTLSEFATKAGYTLEGVISAFTQANILLDLGGGNYRILDFDRFAKEMNLGNSTSEEYQKALKTYNDGLIEAERYFTEEIIDEVTNLKDAKLGTKVNLTSFEQALFKNADFSDRLDFRTQLFNMGALLKDGVLDIQSQANLPGIIQLINKYAAQYGGLLESEVAELADTLREVLNSFAEALSKGISGTLTNVEATDLAANAKNMYGIDLRFTQTAEGLKVSTDQAIQLYNRMSQVDSISSKIVFDDLAEELTAAGEACETMSSTLAEIKRLEKEGTSAAQERLNVYRQIAATQMNNPDSYNFMDKKLSNGMQGPVNYWNSVGEMFKTWNEAKANGGKIDVQDFYNIVNELNNLAEIGGDIEFLGHKLDGNMESAAQLINEGMAALTNVDGEGVKVDLSKFAADFLTGTTNMGAGIEDGIHAMAQSQMDMLDGLIKLLETIKAMEKLGEIDANTDGVLDFGEMFGELSGGFYEVKDKAQNAAQAILDQANQSEELNKNLSLIKFNDTSLLKMLTTMAKDGKVAEDQAHLYNQVMSSLYQMVLSGDYDLENLQESILQLLQVNGAIGEIDLGNGIKFAVGYGVTLQPNEKNEYVIGDHKYPANQVQEALADAAFSTLGLQGSHGVVSYDDADKRYEQILTVTDGVSMTLAMEEDGVFKYQVDGQDYDSYKEALYAIWINTMTEGSVDQEKVAAAVASAMEKGYEAPGFLEWLATVGEKPIIIPTPPLEIDTSNLQSSVPEAIKKAQTEAIKWANGVDAKNIDFDALTSIGININANTERSWGNIQQVFSALDIEDKTMNVDVTTNPEDEAAASIVEAINSDEPIVKDVILRLISDGAKWLLDLFSSDNQTTTSTENNQFDAEGNDYVPPSKQRLLLTNKLNDKQKELDQVNAELSTAQETINDLNNEKAQLDAEIVTLKSQLVENENKITDAELISSDLRDQLSSKEAENLSLTTQITEKQEKINELTKQLNEASQRANEAELIITSLQAEIKELNIKISSLENSMTAFEKRWAERRTQVDIDENSYKEGKAYNLAQDKIDTDEDFYITTKDAANTLYWKMQSLISQPQTGILSAHDVSLNGSSLLPNIEEDEIPYYNDVINKLQSAKIDTFNKLNSAKSINEINEILAAFEVQLQNIKNTGITDYNDYSIYRRPAGMYDKPTDRKEFSDYFSSFVANLLQEATNQARTNKNIAPQWSTYEYLPEGIQYNESALMGFSSDDIASLFQKFREFYNTTQNFEETIKYLNEQWPELLNNINAEDIFKSFDTPPSGGVGDEQPLQTPPEEPIIGSDEVNINGEEVILSGDDINHPFYGADKGETPPSIDETVWNGLDQTIRDGIIDVYESMPTISNFESWYGDHKGEDWPKFSELFPEDAADTLATTGEEFTATTLAATTGLIYMGGQFVTLTEQTGTAQDGVNALGNASSVTGGKAYLGRNGISSFGTAIGKFTTDLINKTTELGNTKIKMPSFSPTIPPIVRAKGNVALAAGNQHTLMGELGPELVVSNGHYFVAGQNGAEFVNLPADAIVFNHLQTEQLLKNGSSGRGKAVTNERKATSMATGNAHGPAFAGGIDAAIAELKRIYAMWKALGEATSKDMGMLAGSGGGGGGGGGKGIDKGFIEDLERWYTILQQIAKLERDINYEEKLRTKLNSDLNKNGYEYYDSQVRSLKSINEQIGKQRELVSLQQGYLNERVNDLNSSVWGQIYHATEDMITYNDTSENAGIRLLAELMRQKENNELVHTGKEQYDILVKNIPGIEEFLKFDPNGEEINTDEDGYGKAVEGFLETADARKDEIQDLIDSVADTKNEILDNENTRNQILQDMMDNQLSLEQEIVKAIEEREQAIIDNLKDTRDALDEAQNAFIDGLSDQLDKERNMYDKQQANEDLNKLRRQLSILQRSGGSASSIASLQEQIRGSEQDTYFEAQQQQIDAIQEASDKEIERLDAQIDLMTETLEYQKEHGLLWNEVYQIMAMEEADILAFIQSNGKDWESKSSLEIEKDTQALKYIIERYIGRREDSDKYVEEALADTTVSQSQNIEPFQPHHDKKEGSSSSSSNSGGKTGGGGGGSSGGGGYSGKTSTTTNTKKWHVEGVSLTFNTSSEAVNYVNGIIDSITERIKKITPDQLKDKEDGKYWKKQINNLVKQKQDWIDREISQYKAGGLVDYTGLAMVHGSKSKPEAFIDADTTKFIMDELKGKNGLLVLANRMKQEIQDTIENKKLTNNTTSPVLQQLRQIREMWNNLQNQAYTTVQSASEAQRNEASVIIENATVEVNVPSVANDYDSRRIGSQALDEMLRIARKTTSVSINGR